MAKDYILLGEVAAHLKVLDVKCGRCDRHGRLRVDRLLVQYGPEASVTTVLRALVADCPHRDAQQERGRRCDPYSPGLGEALR